MTAPPPDPASSDPDAISDAVDQMEERIVGHRVDPPPSDDLGDQDDDPEDQDVTGGREVGSEPS